MAAPDSPWKSAIFGELDGLKKFVELEVKVDEQDERGFTPLNWAARNGHEDVLKYLVEK